MEMNDFYDFSSKMVSSTVHAHAIGLKTDEKGINDEWNLVKGKYQGIEFPVIFRQTYGKKFTDILGTGWPCLYLISEKLKGLLEENRLTGWTIFPIKLYDKKGKEIHGYHGFSIVGRCVSISYEKSEIIEKRLVPTGPICRFYKGVTIENWDGTDFFTPEKTYEIFISKKAAEVLEKNKITNLRLQNLSDFETSERHVKKLGA